jgi:uncharacterized protein (DUF58 family)
MTPTAALRRCGTLAALLVAAGLASGRVDLVVLAAPFLIARAIAAGARLGDGRRTIDLRVTAAAIHEHDTIETVVSVTADAHLDAVDVRLDTKGFAAPPSSRIVTAITAGRPTVLRTRLRPGRWGRWRIGPVSVRGYGQFGFTRDAEEAVAGPIGVRVVPDVEPFHATEAVPRALAYAGMHRTRTIGPGVEFAVVREFTAGDRPRRINWRTTLRTSRVHVNTTTTERGAEVLILIDSQHDAGQPGDTILDVTVRAAASIAEHYLMLGDRLGLVEYGGHNRALPAGAGPRQIAHVHDWLLDVSPPTGVGTPRSVEWLASKPVERALVIALTPLLDEEAAVRLAVLRRRGASVAAVDTLPDDALPATTDLVDAIACRLWLLEREVLAGRLGDIGVPVIRWAGAGSLDTVLVDLARIARGPRQAVR